MLDTILTIAAIVLIGLGVVFEILAVLGVFKFKFVLNRMHSAAIGDTLSLGLVILGCMLLSGLSFTTLKLLVIILFFFITGPVSSHLLANLTVKVDKSEVDEICNRKDIQ